MIRAHAEAERNTRNAAVRINAQFYGRPDGRTSPDYVKEKHFMRKHGPNAYYGQR